MKEGRDGSYSVWMERAGVEGEVAVAVDLEGVMLIRRTIPPQAERQIERGSMSSLERKGEEVGGLEGLTGLLGGRGGGIRDGSGKRGGILWL
jgi:hypothetical protein